MLERLWVTGYRAWELNAYRPDDPKITVIKSALRERLLPLLDEGLTWLITGGESGVEQWSAALGLALKADWPALQVAMMTPFADFGHQWNEANQAALQQLQQQVDFARSTSSGPYTTPKQLAGYTNFMAQHTDGALMVYDPEFEGKPQFAWRAAEAEAKRRAYPLLTISMGDLEAAARDYAESQQDYDDPAS